MKALYRVKPVATGRYQAVVRWEEGGTRHRKYFDKASKAKAWAEARAIEARNSGLGVIGMTDELRVLAIQGQEACAPFGKTIADAVAVALGVWKAQADSVSVKKAVESLLASRAGHSVRYRRDLAERVEGFAGAFGYRLISSIAPKEIREWLQGLPVGAVSKNNVRRNLSVLFAHAIESEWCPRERGNIIKQVSRFKEPVEKIGILTPDEARKLLAGAPARFVPYLAIALFCGPRRSELERTEAACIRFDSGLVELIVTKTRGASRRFVKMRANCRAWLAAYPFVKLTAQQFRKDLEAAIETAGIRSWPNNATRHSFCSYSLAHERDVNDLTLEMGHTDPDTLFAHYRELVTPADAREYWGINPFDRAAAIAAA
jgi:integrase